MKALNRIADSLEAISAKMNHLEYLWQRIAIALEPEQKEEGPKPVQPVKDTPAKVNVAERRGEKPRCRYKGYFGLQNFRKYGYSEKQMSDYCIERGIDVFRINGHYYCKEGDYNEFINGIK